MAEQESVVPDLDIDRNEENKETVWSLWEALDNGGIGNARAILEAACAPDVVFNGPSPIGLMTGIEAYFDDYLVPFMASFPDCRRESFLFFGGVSNGRVDGDVSRDGRYWVTGTGNLHATFTEDFLGIPANGEKVHIRWGEFVHLDDTAQIVETYFLLDLIDLLEQVGVNVLPTPRGTPGRYPAPAAEDGILRSPQPVEVSRYSLEHIRAFIFDGLNAFDQDDLTSMGMADWFHSDVRWYGPGGIGACLSFQEFEDLHQAPWLVAFPDRSVQNLDALFAEGVYTGAPGWAGVKARHTGEYLDVPATGNAIDFNGLDWWKRDGEEYIENWVFVDMVHLFEQFGIDLFERIPRSG